MIRAQREEGGKNEGEAGAKRMAVFAELVLEVRKGLSLKSSAVFKKRRGSE